MKRFLAKIMPDMLLQRIKKVYYSRSTRLVSAEEEKDLCILGFVVSQGDTVVDVGANYGVYTRALSKLVGEQGQVIAIEPIPETFAILKYSVRKWKLNNVKLLQYAISNKAATLLMTVPRYERGGGANYYRASVSHGASEGLRSVSVRAETLDHILAENSGQVSFMKMDVEGHELECFLGAGELLTKHRPSILVELSGDPDLQGTQACQVFALLRGHGYQAYWFDGKALRRREAGDRSINYFFFQDGHLANLADQDIVARPSD